MTSNLTIWHIQVPGYTGHLSAPTTDQAQMLAWTRRIYAVPDHQSIVVKKATDYTDHR